MKHKLLYLLIMSLINFLAIIPKFLRRNFFYILSLIVFFFAKKTNRIIKTNLNFVFKNKLADREIISIQKYTYFNILQWVQTIIENMTITSEEVKNDVTIENVEIIKKLLEENKKIIFISAHYGNIEVLSSYLNRFVLPVTQVARKSNFRIIEDYITKSREKSGATIVYKEGALRHLIKAMKHNKAISLIIDQNITPKDSVEVDFLGKRVYQSTAATILARKFDAYIVPLAIFNLDNYKYKIKIYDTIAPINTDNGNDDFLQLTQLQANAISKIIEEDPKQWFWAHKRFKGHNKEIYE